MPNHHVDWLADAFGKECSIRVPRNLDSYAAQALTKRLTDRFAVSRDAGRVRLRKLGQLAGGSQGVVAL
jgi:hypothetical protein